jgi:hypothetical protein
MTPFKSPGHYTFGPYSFIQSDNKRIYLKFNKDVKLSEIIETGNLHLIKSAEEKGIDFINPEYYGFLHPLGYINKLEVLKYFESKGIDLFDTEYYLNEATIDNTEMLKYMFNKDKDNKFLDYFFDMPFFNDDVELLEYFYQRKGNKIELKDLCLIS